MRNGIVEIAEAMHKEPTYTVLVKRSVGRYELVLKKAKVWFHSKIDYEYEIFDLKTKKTVAQGSGHDESEEKRSYSGLKPVFNAFKSEKDVRAWIKAREF